MTPTRGFFRRLLDSELPHLAQGHLTVDASGAGVILDGRDLPNETSGLVITSDENAIKGLQILRFPENGVIISEGARNNIIGGDRLEGSGLMGEGNLISGNGGCGISIQGTGTMSNTVAGNYIGTDLNGTVTNSNRSGIHISGASHNIVGGATSGARNLISGNAVYGIQIGGQGTENNIVVGNFIGTDASGRTRLGNREGIAIGYYARHNRIGGTAPGERNLISGNRWDGVNIMEIGTTSNWVVGNYVGTDVDGTADLGNGTTGIIVQMGASGNTIGWNVSSGNGQCGIQSSDSGSDYNVIIGNLVGTDATGAIALGNDWGGVCIGGGAAFNRVGGTAPDERNVIGSNGWTGVSLYSRGGTDNLIVGNFIGTDASSTQDLGNAGEGIRLGNATRRAFVGGTTEGERNIISGNGGPGIALEEAGVEHNFIAGNYIGTDAGGMMALGNNEAGVAIRDHAGQNVLQGNLLSGNEWDGVNIGNGSDFNHLRANLIGVAADGVQSLPNGADGVQIEATSNTVGGSYPEDGNIIAYNNLAGVRVWTYPSNTIRRNSIHSNLGPGIHLADGANNSMPAPVITDVLPDSVLGSACPGCVVEVFSDEEDEGQVYEGSAIADGSGNWTWTGSLTSPYVTATATDEVGNTSPFSAPQMGGRHYIYVPLILRE